jgi:hypothetical protein
MSFAVLLVRVKDPTHETLSKVCVQNSENEKSKAETI